MKRLLQISQNVRAYARAAESLGALTMRLAKVIAKGERSSGPRLDRMITLNIASVEKRDARHTKVGCNPLSRWRQVKAAPLARKRWFSILASCAGCHRIAAVQRVPAVCPSCAGAVRKTVLEPHPGAAAPRRKQGVARNPICGLTASGSAYDEWVPSSDPQA